MENASAIFEYLETQGDQAMEILRAQAFNPNTRKKLKQWGITETAELIGRSAQHIRQQEKNSAIPQADTGTKGRTYSLEQINYLRDHFGTRPSKAISDETCIIAFANFKGGAAKTTSSVHAAQYFAKAGYRTLFIDCDSQASATQMFGYNPDEHINNDDTLLPYLLEEIDSLETVIRKTYWPGLDFIPANLSLYGAEFTLPARSANAISQKKTYNFYAILQTGLNKIKDKYDLIILDCPPSMGVISINAIYAANAFIIPVPPSMLDFASTIQFFAMLKEVLSNLPQKQYAFIRLLITKHDGQDSSTTLVDTIRALFGNFVMQNVMYNSEAIKKASSDLLTIYEIEKYHGSKSTYNRALHLLNELNREIEKTVRKTWISCQEKSTHESHPDTPAKEATI
jgi:chromosome partitioning protein